MTWGSRPVEFEKIVDLTTYPEGPGARRWLTKVIRTHHRLLQMAD